MISHHEDEVIDTISLSDLLIYDNNGDPQDFYDRLDGDQMQSPSIIDGTDDQFEFSSELLKTRSVINNGSHVVFCGNIIPYKDYYPAAALGVSQDSLLKLENMKKMPAKSHKQRWRFLKESNSGSNGDSSESSKLGLKRVSILASDQSKPKWYLLMFGFGSSSGLISAQMHVRDLKKRRDKKMSGGSWRLLNFLGCGGADDNRRHPNAIMKIQGLK